MHRDTIELWSIDQCEHPYEMEWRDYMVRQLIGKYQGLEENCSHRIHLVFGLRLPGAEIDLLAITPSDIYIGEMKRAVGRLSGEMNGRWHRQTDRGPRVWGGGKNPYEQIRRYRSTVVSEILEFQRNSRYTVIQHDRPYNICRAGLVQVPTLNLKSSINDIWWYASGAAEWLPMVLGEQGPERICMRSAASWLANIGCERFNLAHAARELGIHASGPAADPDAEWQSLKTLDEAQTRAAFHPRDRHLAIIAGPGSGKTRVVVERAQYLVAGNDDESWLAVVSYTNTAANEISSKLMLSDKEREKIFIGTFHSFAVNMLDRTAGVAAPETILDEATSLWRYSCICGVSEWEAREQIRIITTRSLDDLDLQIQANWALFLSHLAKQKVATFESLLHQIWEVVEQQPDVLPSHMIYDEYQDVSPMQGRLVRRMADAGVKVTVVGDPEQAIFGFNGGSPESMTDFANDLPESCVAKLECNYRSGSRIVEMSASLRNPDSLPLHIRPSEGQNPGEWTAKVYESDTTQAAGVAEWMRSLNEGHGVPWKNMAVIFRDRGSLPIMSKALSEGMIPVKNTRHSDFRERPLRELLELTGLRNDLDDPERFMRLVEASPWLSHGLLREVVKTTLAEDAPTVAGVEGLVSRIPDRYRREVRSLADRLNRVVDEKHDSKSAELQWLWDEVVSRGLSIEEERKRDEFQRVVGGWSEYLATSPDADFVDLSGGDVGDDEEGDGVEPDQVQLTTIHSAKGNEWEAVAIVDICDSAFVRSNSDMDEEMRLIHVAASRAEKWLHLGFPNRRGLAIDVGVIRAMIALRLGCKIETATAK